MGIRARVKFDVLGSEKLNNLKNGFHDKQE